MKRPNPRLLTVLRKNKVTAHLLRLTFGGESMATFPSGQEGSYIKLMFPGDEKRHILRTYTVRKQRDGEIDVDFALHGDGGLAATWAQECPLGESILVGGPGPGSLVNPAANWFLLAGDIAALPALSVNLETMPRDARGAAFIEVPSEEDKQVLDAPRDIQIYWLINPHPGKRPELLRQAIEDFEWEKGRPFVWAASEFGTMQGLRTYLRGTRGLGKEQLYLSSYWKLGITEEEHKETKRADAQKHSDP
ncbi:Vibriobactin utilization protein ViuB [Rubripirellula lacrimiformis]|uniref:Vibriobactin utilization protein ViuB n=1 Tax=Rubripirellula lacrimiformis TaxID=1930273 RepID=A0A517N7H2_9BACT|nr:siderophore-interacting protein [Rubripirellula lacrimiformis]QDT03093.1 Vibriobactin utilization protein ViuB [Rubripirellula lacrimiformis]